MNQQRTASILRFGNPLRWARDACPGLAGIFLAVCLGIPSTALAQPPQCDPSKVLSADACSKCHAGEVATWRQTPHFETFEALHRNPRAREIAERMGQRSIKRGDLCINCHYTLQQTDDALRAISGISCESCHGAAADWLAVHNDYGGPTATRQSESLQHRQARIESSIAAGMRNPANLYLVAQSCLQCHTVPEESLVNDGSHKAGSQDFELVAWSQGRVRHNFLRTDGKSNAANNLARLRVMYVVGQIADLEYSTRATGLATQRATYGLTCANRAATVAVRLYEIQQRINDPLLEQVLRIFAGARLALNNPEQLNDIAERIRQLGIEFASRADGEQLAAVDAWLPDPATYR
jgi:hypothetical protein